MVPCVSQRVRKLCSLLLFVGSVFVGFFFFFWEYTYTIKCSLLVTLLLNVAFVSFDVDIGQWYEPPCVQHTLPALCSACILLFSPGNASAGCYCPCSTDEKAEKILSVGPSVWLESTCPLHTTCLHVPACNEGFLWGLGAGYSVSWSLQSPEVRLLWMSRLPRLHGHTSICAPVLHISSSVLWINTGWFTGELIGRGLLRNQHGSSLFLLKAI